MGFVIENKGGSITDQQQSVGNERDFDIIQTGNSRVDCVLQGLVVTAQSGTSNESYVAVSSGSVLTNGVLKAVAGITGSSGLYVGASPDSTYSMIRVVVVNSSGTLTFRSGTPAAIPLMPTLTANDVPIAAILVPPDSDGLPVAILTNDITDKRILVENGPITLYKTIAAETTNTTAAAIHVLNKTSSGVSIPAGLMTTGRILRCTIGGTIKNTDITPTLKLEIIYGATTMYSQTSEVEILNTAALLAWHLTFDILAQGNSDLTLNGEMCCTALGGISRTAPTTGNGPSWGTANAVFAFSGAATDSNAAARTLAVTLTFNASDDNSEVITELALLELL